MSREFIASTEVAARPEEVYDWHMRPGAFRRLVPPWNDVQVVERPAEGIRDGSRVVLSVKTGPLRRRWVAVHRDVRPGRGFSDEQLKGPFAEWFHEHRFEPHDEGCLLQDRVRYRLPFGFLGRALGGRYTERQLRSMFGYRHRITVWDLKRHRRTGSVTPLKVAISGASGLVGSALRSFLATGGHEVFRLVRGEPEPGGHEVVWDPHHGLGEPDRLDGVDAVVHLAGANIAAGRWNARRKAAIRDSRVVGTRRLCQGLAQMRRPPRVLVAASAIGYYGDRGTTVVDEGSEPGEGFLADVCRDWEAATEDAERAGIRVVHLRVGVVLSSAGGALKRMLFPFRIGAGGIVGDGRQFVSWISLEDLLGAIHHALFDATLSGAVNAVAPEPVTNAELTRALGEALRRPTVAPLPAFVVRTLFGEMGQALLLASTRVAPRRLEQVGFEFLLPRIDEALTFALGRFDA